MLINEEIKDAINIDLDRKDLRELVYKDEDTYTLLQDGLIKAVQGITTLEEVLKLVELDDSEPEKGFEKEETKVEIAFN